MPILDIELVGEPPREIRRDLAARLAEAAGEALDSRPGGTWVKLMILPEGDYAENAGGPDDGVRPVFVSLIKRSLPCGEALQREVAVLTRVVAEVCRRPAENVHLIYRAAAAGRVAFGGKLVT
jgi:phenylpyruvate tautomerase PptA (4-oxalocrotonate tautomerase family)